MMISRLFIVLPLAFSSIVHASETRMTTLQRIDGIQDESDIFTYSGRIARYNVALLELGKSTNTDIWGAAVARISSNLNLGAAVNRHTWQKTYATSDTSMFMAKRFLYGATSNSSSTATDALLLTGSRSVDFLGSFALSKDASIGFRLSNAKEGQKTSDSSKNTDTNKSADATEIAGGYSYVGNSAIDTNLTILVVENYKYSSTNAGVTNGVSYKAGTSARLDGRWLLNAHDSGFYVNGVLASSSASSSVTTSNVDKSAKFSDQVIIIGGGYAFTPKDQPAKVYAGANIVESTSTGPKPSGSGATFKSSQATSDDTVKVTAQFAAAALSAESKFYENFGAMIGTRYTFYGTIVEKDDIAQTKSTKEIIAPADADFWSLGLYWASEKTRVDGSISKSLLHNGPYLIAGNATNPMLARISATYNF